MSRVIDLADALPVGVCRLCQSAYAMDFTELPPVKLDQTREQREMSEQLADLYSLLVTIEHVETAYVRDAISNTKESHILAAQPGCTELSRALSLSPRSLLV